MSVPSILFDEPPSNAGLVDQSEPFFADLHLDQIFGSLMVGREEYNLTPFFYIPLNDAESITYRHEVMRDLEENQLRTTILLFAENLRAMRAHLAQAEKLYYEYQKASWFLDAVDIYCDAVVRLVQGLSVADIKSRALLAFRRYLECYVSSEAFQCLCAETKKRKNDLSAVMYGVQIRGNRITVTKYAGEPDYSAEVEATFRKFQQGSVKDYQVAIPNPLRMNHVEAKVLDCVARLYPETFMALREYCDRYRDYLDEAIGRFDREVQFYLAYLDLMDKLKSTGLMFCYPEISEESKEVSAYETFDLALANRLLRESSKVVCNDFYLKGPERILVVSGPNQGGKTTFARTFGQLHYLARLGYPVPGRQARLFLCDRLFTHFERQEHMENLRGKLQDELIRIHEILQQATSKSILILNETFSSTTLQDALFLGRELLDQIIQRDMLCVYVTFLDELSALGEATVSMVSTVDPDNPAVRTYKLERKPADGLAYAVAIAKKYGLTYELVKRRVMR